MPRGDPHRGTFPKPTPALRRAVAGVTTKTERYEIDMGDLHVFKSAVFDPERAYRYELRRIWDEAATKLVVIGLNPSTADAKKDDPTIRKCVGFARRWKMGGIIMLNLFAYRATDPKMLRRFSLRHHAVGLDNDDTILGITGLPGTKVLCAWGAHGVLDGRGDAVFDLLQCRKLHHMGLTKGGHPKHPLYLPYTTKLQEW